MSIFGEIAPLFNPFGLMRGVKHAVQDVFDIPTQPKPPQVDLFSNLPIDRQKPHPLIGPGGSERIVDWGHGNVPLQHSASTSTAEVWPPSASQPLGLGLEAPPALALGAAPPARSLDTTGLYTVDRYTQPFPESIAGDIESKLWSQMPEVTGMSPDEILITGANAGQPQPLYNPLAPPANPPQPDPTAPGGGPMLTPMDFMRAQYMRQFTNADAMASGNLRYMQQDLDRRSRRDRSDDFFSSVLAPVAGGMSRDPGQISTMAQGWQDQAQGRRGERMNLINSLVGRQNRAAEFLQATDPQAFANQMKLMKAQTDMLRATNQGTHWGNQDKNKERELTYKEQEAISKNYLRESQRQYYDARIKSEGIKMEEMVLNGQMSRKTKEALIKRWEDLKDQSLKKLELEHDKMFMMDANADADRTSREQIAANAQTGSTQRTQMNIDAAANRQATSIQAKNLYAANKLNNKGKPTMTEQFRQEAMLPPMVQHQLQKYRSVPPTQRALLRQTFIQRYGYDPGE